ncbi:hypothetical protein DID88_006418 [Monilinia fructigena]|uniref:Major facilitator superfamily (MFS) profile domain-containing protein n=1 Tax=Monilinia fructigena TaxID=38457 RepID=A0A395IDM2_9HELO|nr:hypothetical protein DID88_006418 [Monilinia fructigena]
MAQLMTQAALAQAIAPLHVIGDSFGTTNPGQLSWFAAAYSLTVGTFILIAGRLGDLYGHKILFISGFFWFALWSLLAGFSAYSNAIFFDVARALQGIGPAFLLPNALAILARIYEPGRKKEMIFSLFGATAPAGFTLGATFSALFRIWFGGLGHIGSIISVSMLKRTDAAGAITGVAGLVLVNFSWNQGPVIGWSTVYVYVILIIGALVLGLFAFIESRAPYPYAWFSYRINPNGYGSYQSKHTGAQTFVATVVTPWGMDMSFPAATILLSNSMHKDHQGLAASLVNTVVNYSISIGLGIAGTVEIHVNNDGKDVLRGYPRSAIFPVQCVHVMDIICRYSDEHNPPNPTLPTERTILPGLNDIRHDFPQPNSNHAHRPQTVATGQSPSASPRSMVDQGILDPLRSRYMSQHSAVAFPRSLGMEFQSANPPPLHSFAWNCGIRTEEAASAHTNLSQLISHDDFKRYSDIYFATVHAPFGFLDWPYFMRRCDDYWNGQARDLTFGAVVGGVVALGSFFAFRLGHPRELDIVQHVENSS